MRQAAATHWRAAAWLLERTNPQRFARQNVRHLKPEQVTEVMALIGQIVAEEVNDPAAHRRIAKRLSDLQLACQRETRAEIELESSTRPRSRPSTTPPEPFWRKHTQEPSDVGEST